VEGNIKQEKKQGQKPRNKGRHPETRAETKKQGQTPRNRADPGTRAEMGRDRKIKELFLGPRVAFQIVGVPAHLIYRSRFRVEG